MLVSGREADEGHDGAHGRFEATQGLSVRKYLGVRGAGKALVDVVVRHLALALEDDLLEGVPEVDLGELASEELLAEVVGEEVGPVVAYVALGVARDGIVEDGLDGGGGPRAGARLEERVGLHEPIEEQDARGVLRAHGGPRDGNVVVRAVLLDG